MKKIILCLFLLLGANISFGQWNFVGGPKTQAVSISLIKFNGDTIYAGSYDGVYRSTDNGQSWTAINSGLPTSGLYNINCLEFYDNNVFVGTNNGLYILYSDSLSWHQLGTNLTNKIVTSIKFVGQNIIVSTLYNGIFISTDGGINWIESNSGLSSLVVYELVNDNSNLFIRMDGKIFCSTDTAKTWILIDSHSIANGFFSAIAVQDSNIYIGTSWGYLFRTTNKGENWDLLTSVYSGDLIQSITTNGSTVFFNTYDEIYRSTNNGTSWAITVFGLPNKQIYSSIKVQGTNLYVGIFDDGIYTSSNNGTNWSLFGKVLTYDNLLSLTVSDSNIFVGTYNGIFHSSDDGNNWISSNSGLPQFNFTYALANNGSNIYAGNDYGVYLSTNNGNSWNAINQGLPSNIVCYSIAILDSNIFAGTDNGIYRSINNGNSWSPSSQGLPANSIIKSLGVDGSNIYAGLVGSVYLSSDNGSSWGQTDLGTSDWTINAILFQNSNLFIISNGTIYFSRDYGSNWRIVDDGLPNQNLKSIYYDNSFLYVATDQAGIWKISIDDNILDVKDKQKFLISNFELSQNYPNPFNPSTKINYQLPAAGNVTLKVYDVLGNEVATLIDANKSAGSYEVEFKSTVGSRQLANGVYFYQLKAGDYLETKKMILLK